MADRSSIEWTDRTWNPVTGCTKISPGCEHCYAEAIARRFSGTPAFPGGFAVTLHPGRLAAPLRWRVPSRVFVNSMSDLFHPGVPRQFLVRVFAVMALTPQHTYQVLTKRHGRMRSLLTAPRFRRDVCDQAGIDPALWATAPGQHVCDVACERWIARRHPHRDDTGRRHTRAGCAGCAVPAGPGGLVLDWPLPNVWLGVSAEDQARAGLRIPALLDTPAVVRFVSCEPLLGPLRLEPAWLDHQHGPALGWVIAGGESGPQARPMHPDWARALRDTCQAAGVPFFFKQWGQFTPTHPEPGEAAGPVRLVDPHGRSPQPGQPPAPGAVLMTRTGKKHAGRVLDGRTWDEFPPEVSTP